MSLVTRYDLANELGKIIHSQTVSIADYRNGDLSLVRLRAMINRIHRNMIIEIDKTHERTKLDHAQTHRGTDAPKRGGPEKEEKRDYDDDPPWGLQP